MEFLRFGCLFLMILIITILLTSIEGNEEEI